MRKLIQAGNKTSHKKREKSLELTSAWNQLIFPQRKYKTLIIHRTPSTQKDIASVIQKSQPQTKDSSGTTQENSKQALAESNYFQVMYLRSEQTTRILKEFKYTCHPTEQNSQCLPPSQKFFNMQRNRKLWHMVRRKINQQKKIQK